MRADKYREVAEDKARVVMRRADRAGKQSIARPFVGAENLRAGDFLRPIKPRQTKTDDGAAGQTLLRFAGRPMRVHHRVENFAVSGAAAQHAAERVLRFRFIWRRIGAQQSDSRQQHGRRANSALRGAVAMESALKLADNFLVQRQAFGGFDETAIDLTDGGQARADRLAVNEDGAGTAIAGVAADFDADQSALFTQRMAQPLERGSDEAGGGAVKRQGNADRAIEHQQTPPASPLRQTSTARRTSVKAASRR